MSIDYIKNVIIAKSADDISEVKFIANGFPASEPFIECIVRQIPLVIDPHDSNYDGEVFYIWSDISNSYIGSVMVNQKYQPNPNPQPDPVNPDPIDPEDDYIISCCGMVNLNSKFSVNKIINGDRYFNVHRLNSNGNFEPYTNFGVLTLHLEFVRYAKK